MQDAAITLRSLGSAFDDDAGGRAISHPLSSLLVEGCPCGADLSSAFGAPLLQGATLPACKNGICERNQYSLKYKNTASLTFPFTPLRKPTSAPSGHLLPEEGGRMPPHRLPMKKAYDTRIPLSHIRHFERTREIFFVRGEAKAVRGAVNGKHRASCDWGGRCFMQELYEGKRKRETKKIPRLRSG